MATSLSSILNLLLLFLVLRKRLGGIGGRKIFVSAVKVAVSSVLMGIGVYVISLLVDWSDGGITVLKLLELSAAVVFGVVSYLVFARFFKSPELVFLIDMLQEKWSRSNAKSIK